MASHVQCAIFTDCDSNDDCADGLICYQRSEFENVPGCSGGLQDGSLSDYCVPRSLVPETYLVPMGDKLVGNPDDNFGSSVSFSQSEPLLMAVGAVDRGSTGYVNIYQLTGDNDWKLAATIQGDEIGSDFGHSVSMSWDGKYVAVGMPRSKNGVGGAQVFDLSALGTAARPQRIYRQVGEDIRFDSSEWVGFGSAVSLSQDGRIIAVTEQSHFAVYQRTNSEDWVLLGSVMDIGSFGGGSVSLSGDGSRVAVNVKNYDDPTSGYGRVYEFNVNVWVQLGQTLGDLTISDRFGLSNIDLTSSSLSGDGTTVAMSCVDGGNSYVRVYRDTGDREWVPMGEPIISKLDEYAPASKVEISKDGEMVAIGDYELGRVRLYEFETKTERWTLVGEMQSLNEDDQFAAALALAGARNEAYLAIGAPNKKHIIGNPGYAVAYKTSFGIRPDEDSVPTSVPTDSSEGGPSFRFSVDSVWYGESQDEITGKSVALSGDGRVMARGVSSKTSMSKIDIYVDGSSANHPPQLTGSVIGDEFGYSIALSHNGQRMAVGIPNSGVGPVLGAGRVEVYDYDQTRSTWFQMGGDLVGSIPFESGRFGHSVALNRDGNIVAVGAPGSETGVSIFRFENNEWVKMGNDIAVSVYKYALHGWSVSLSYDGLVVAIGGPTNEDNWDESGACRIYEYVNNNWQPRGQPILGQLRHALLGTSVSLSEDGNIVAIGAINYELPETYINKEEEVYRHGEKAGAVFAYKYSIDAGDWEPLGKFIYGNDAFDRLGTSVSLATHEDKLYLAAGAPEHGGGGQVRLFVFDEEHSYWDQIFDLQRYDASDDFGKNAGYGTTLALVGGTDGLRLAVGAPRARSGWDETLGLLPKYVGEVTLWTQFEE